MIAQASTSSTSTAIQRNYCSITVMPNSKAKQAEYEPFDWESLSPQPVIGVDEVGRGCLAGPVYAAAVILKPESVSRLGALGVTDSKLLSAAKRELLAKEILDGAWVGKGFATAQEIDEINILQATFLSMRRALFQLERSWLEQSVLFTATIAGIPLRKISFATS